MLNKDKKGFLFKSFREFDGLGIHKATFMKYLENLPDNNGWVHFAIYESKGGIYPKSLMPQFDASPKEVSLYLWEMNKPGAMRIDFEKWLPEYRIRELKKL